METRDTAPEGATDPWADVERREYPGYHFDVYDADDVDRARAAVEAAHRQEIERLRNEATRLVDAERRRWYAAIGGDVEGLAPEVAVERLTQERDTLRAERDSLAAHALMGLLASGTSFPTKAACAEYAYQMADAMLAARTPAKKD